MDQQKPQSTPYSTTNAALAVTLRVCGVPWAKAEDGKPVPCFNFYTADILRGIETDRAKAGLTPLGLLGKSMDEGIRIAHRAGIPGKVVYTFQRTPTLHAIVEGWDEQSKLIDAAEKGEKDAETKTGTLTISPEMAARVCCQYAKTRKDFFGDKHTVPIWKRVPPLNSSVEASTQNNGSRPELGSVTTGSFKARSVKL